MPKTQDREPGRSPPKGKTAPRVAATNQWVARKHGSQMTIYSTRIEAVMASAERTGLLQDKTGRIGGRVSPALVERAKANTGISTDTELLEFALANVALDDGFAESFKAVRGTVDPELKLGF